MSQIDANSSMGYQSENVFFNQYSIETIGTFPVEGLNDLVEAERPKIFGNFGKAIAADQIHLLKYSLTLSVGLPLEDWHYKLVAGVMHA